MGGVVKLGFSRMEDDVLPFCGVKSLTKNLDILMSQNASNQIVCLVQEMVPDVVCELRVVMFHNAARNKHDKERIWIRLRPKGKVQAHHEMKRDVADFSLANVLKDDEALEEFFKGSREA